MCYKGLNIIQENIDDCLNGICNEMFHSHEMSMKEHRGGAEHKYTIEGLHNGEKKTVVLSFIFKTNATTTIYFKQGKERELGKSIAEAIKTRLVLDERPIVYISVSNMDNENLSDIIACMRDDFHGLVISSKQIQNAHQQNLKLPNGEKLILNFFSTGTLSVSGRPLMLFNGFTSYLTDLDYLGAEKVAKDTSKYYKLEGDIIDFKRELKSKLPIAYEVLPANIRELCLCSIINEKIDFNFPDYSHVVLQVLKAIEGLIKHFLREDGYILKTQAINIFVNGKDVSNLQFIPDVDKALSSTNKKIIVDLYRFYYKERHSLSHASQIDATTRMLRDKSDASEILDNSLVLINKAYDLKLKK